MTTNTKVIDASTLAAILFAEEGGRELLPRLGSSPLAAPTLLPYEMTNICVTKSRAAPARRDELTAALRSLPEYGIELHPIAPDEVVSLAADKRLSAYDASYLWLARHLDAELITLDKKLHAAWVAASSPR